jgi:large subunit ribosomal protein L25
MEISVSIRENLGTGNAKKVRKSGTIPGVIYGKGKPAEHLSINAQEFGRLVLREGTGKLIGLKIKKGKKTEQDQVLIKDLQRHPVKGNILHVDFLRVEMDRPVTVKVPLYLENDERKTRDGAIIDMNMYELEISCLPGNIPERIQIPTKELTAGGRIHVKDLELGEGIEAISAPEEVVVQAIAPTVAVETEATEQPESAEPEVTKDTEE